MKSRVLKLWDYREAEFDREIPKPDVEDALEKEYRRLMKRDKKVEESEIVAEDDIVTLDMHSSNPKWEKKNMMLNVGKGIFDREFEHKLVGLSKGDNLIKIGEDEIQLQIREIKRNVYPQLSIERVLEWANSEEGNKEVVSVNGFKEYMKNKCEKEAVLSQINEIIFSVYGQVYMNSEWDFDEEEFQEIYQQIIGEINLELEGKNTSYDTLTDEECKKYFDYENKEELEQLMSDSVFEQLAHQILSCIYSEKVISKCAIDEELPSAYVFIENYVNEQIKSEL